MSCDDGHCVTCADEAVPLLVADVLPGAVAISETGVEVMTDLVGHVEPGDTLLVHAGVALALVDEGAASRRGSERRAVR